MRFQEYLEGFTYGKQQFERPIDALQHIAENNIGKTLGCHFGDLNKVGINPRSTYSTPTGIYCYPIEYVIQKNMAVPYLDKAKHMTVVEVLPNVNILHMRPVKLGKEIWHFYAKPSNAPNDIMKSQKGWDYIQRIPDYYSYGELATGYDIRSDCSMLWLTSMLAAHKNPVKWNVILKNLGIDGFFDHGTGTIHENEPEQFMVLEGRSLKNIFTIESPSRKVTSGEVNPKDLAKVVNIFKIISGIEQKPYSFDNASLVLDKFLEIIHMICFSKSKDTQFKIIGMLTNFLSHVFGWDGSFDRENHLASQIKGVILREMYGMNPDNGNIWMMDRYSEILRAIDLFKQELKSKS